MFVINSLLGYIPVGELPITSELLKKKNFLGHVLDPDDLETDFIRDVIEESLSQLVGKLNSMDHTVCNSLEFNRLILKYGLSRFHLP